MIVRGDAGGGRGEAGGLFDLHRQTGVGQCDCGGVGLIDHRDDQCERLIAGDLSRLIGGVHREGLGLRLRSKGFGAGLVLARRWSCRGPRGEVDAGGVEGFGAAGHADLGDLVVGVAELRSA